MKINAKHCMKFVCGEYNETNLERLEALGAVECKVYVAPNGNVYFLTKDAPNENRIDPIVDEEFFVF